MFTKIKEKLPGIIYISFIDNVDFLISSYSICILTKLLNKISKIILK